MMFMNIHLATAKLLIDFQSSHEPEGCAFEKSYALVIRGLVANNFGHILQGITLYFNHLHLQESSSELMASFEARG